jgi:hypothetical protein
MSLSMPAGSRAFGSGRRDRLCSHEPPGKPGGFSFVCQAWRCLLEVKGPLCISCLITFFVGNDVRMGIR